MASIPGQRVVASSAGSTTSEASTIEVQEPGVTSPPPGLTPLDFTNWSLPLPGAPQTGGLPLPSSGGVSRQAAGPRALGPWAPTLSTPQGMLPVRQQRLHRPIAPYQQPAPPTSQPVALYQQPAPPTSQPVALYRQALLQPSQPITPYQQAVQPPRPAGRGGVAQSPSSAAALTAEQPVQECRRQPTRGRGLRDRLASRPGRGHGLTTGAPATNTQGGAPPQPGCRTRTSRYDPVILASNYRSGGWRKDLGPINRLPL